MDIRVLLADNQVLFRDAVSALIGRIGGFQIVAAASDGSEALQCIRKHVPDLVVIETALPRLPGTEVARRARAEGSSAKFLFLSGRNGRRQVEGAFQSGGCGYVYKGDSASDLLAGIEAVGSGQTYLSPSAAGHLVEIALGRSLPASERHDLTSREQEILQLLAEGMSSKEIADTIHLSVRTVDSHRANLMDKLGIHKISGLVRYAIREGLLNP